MILYIPTSEAEELLALLSKHVSNINPSWKYDMMQQIKEQLPKEKRTINLSESVKKQVEIVLKEKGII